MTSLRKLPTLCDARRMERWREHSQVPHVWNHFCKPGFEFVEDLRGSAVEEVSLITKSSQLSQDKAGPRQMPDFRAKNNTAQLTRVSLSLI